MSSTLLTGISYSKTFWKPSILLCKICLIVNSNLSLLCLNLTHFFGLIKYFLIFLFKVLLFFKVSYILMSLLSNNSLKSFIFNSLYILFNSSDFYKSAYSVKTNFNFLLEFNFNNSLSDFNNSIASMYR